MPKALGACTAVTADDLQRTLGINFRRGQESSAGKLSTCDYAVGNAQVSVTIQQLSGAVDLAAEMEAMKAEMPDAGRVLLLNKLKQRIQDNPGPARDCGAFFVTKFYR